MTQFYFLYQNRMLNLYIWAKSVNAQYLCETSLCTEIKEKVSAYISRCYGFYCSKEWIKIDKADSNHGVS
jgi:hypothetical protein